MKLSPLLLTSLSFLPVALSYSADPSLSNAKRLAQGKSPWPHPKTRARCNVTSPRRIVSPAPAQVVQPTRSPGPCPVRNRRAPSPASHARGPCDYSRRLRTLHPKCFCLPGRSGHRGHLWLSGRRDHQDPLSRSDSRRVRRRRRLRCADSAVQRTSRRGQWSASRSDSRVAAR